MKLTDQGWTDELIAAKLEVTTVAVRLARGRYAILNRTHSGLSAQAIRRRMGIRCNQTVIWWIERGWLPAARIAKRTGFDWHVTESALLTFLEVPEHWHRWDLDAIQDDRLKAWARTLRGHVRFLTIPEAAHRLFVSAPTIHRWIREGALESRRLGNGVTGRHAISEQSVEACARRPWGDAA